LLKSIVNILSLSLISQIIYVLCSPIISRLYSPTEFGYFVFLISFSSIISLIMMGRYENAILIAENNREKNSLVTISLFFGLIGLVLSLLVFIIANQNLSDFFSIDSKIIFYSIPIMALIIAGNNIMLNLLTSNGEFNSIGIAKILGALGLVISQISLFKFGLNGLIAGAFIGYIFSLIYLYLKSKKDITFSSIELSLCKKYINFPRYDLIASLLNALSNQLPNLLLSKLATPNVLGNYSLMNRNLMTPLGLLINSITLVLKRELLIAKKENVIHSMFYKVTIALLFIGFPPSVILYIYGTDIFIFIFGSNWEKAGFYAQFFAPLVLIKLVVSPLSYTLYIYGKQRIDMYMQSIYLLCTSFSLYILFKFNDMEDFLKIYVTLSCLIYAGYYAYCLKLIRNNNYYA